MITYIDTMSSFMKFGGQTFKNVQKVCLKMTLCVLACFVEFYVFLLDEIDKGGPKIVYKHIQIVNIRENIPKDHPRVLEEGPMLVAKIAQGSPTCGWQTTASCLVDAP